MSFDYSCFLDRKKPPGDIRAFRPLNHSHRHKMALRWNSVSITAQHFTSCSFNFSGAFDSRALEWVLQTVPRPSPSVKKKEKRELCLLLQRELYVFFLRFIEMFYKRIYLKQTFLTGINQTLPWILHTFFQTILTNIMNRWRTLLFLCFSVFISFVRGCWQVYHWRCVRRNRCPEYLSDWVSSATERESGWWNQWQAWLPTGKREKASPVSPYLY